MVLAESVKPYFRLFEDPLKLYNSMLADIENASRYIYVETYRFATDSIGIKFRDALARKAKQGIKIKLLLDSWGTSATDSFFREIIDNGGELRFFKKIKITFDFFTRNHRRNHRKLLIIDDNITYMGSANYTEYSLNWRELMIRMEHSIALKFKKSFLDNYKLYKKYIFNKRSYKRIIRHGEYEIVQDIPSIYRQQIKKRYEKLINNAKEEVIIETPYFLPGYMLRKALMDAAKRGVKVQVIVPEHSDVRSVDILRSKYLGMLHKSNVQIKFYQPHNLHAKCLAIDNKIFGIGSANFDYRSFRYMYEIMLIGRDENIIKALNRHFSETLKSCIDFDYDAWTRRPMIEKILAGLLVPVRHLF
ncbi:MAG: phosphatidylserine/phosphatidylglycerophosphate/cardiolipin synthase family protein [Bacteroidales bacterium]|nr:phosphatidylserine/phosphatidylglycerophosphate/cardiolipin synthase family protein [Bacteroidales bacterium]